MKKHLSSELFRWFDDNKRILPWREDRTAYKAWLSEIILQQTRVDQGLPYYYRFIERFPDIGKLAEADEKEVLKLWQGLGYYSRARNLHIAARQIAVEYKGHFPQTYAELKKLKGVGTYTAAAVASMVYNEAVPLVDGNVARVISRLFDEHVPVNTAKGKKVFYKLAEEIFDKANPGKFNEALMEFGALQCTVKPECQGCPLSRFCLAFQNGTQYSLPVKQKAKPKVKRYLHFFWISSDNKILLNKRSAGDIWQGLYQLPVAESEQEGVVGADFVAEKFKIEKPQIHYLCRYEHTLTHRQLVARFYSLKVMDLSALSSAGIWIDLSEISDYPVPRLIEKFFQDNLSNPV